jgi:pantoate--beta-alanine ligase
MKVYSTIEDVRRYRLADPSAEWGLVPTMGYLHQGHLSLVKKALQENSKVGVSIFVNPAQFNDATDLECYPRDLDRDLRLLEHAGVDVVWVPESEEIYPRGYQTVVDVKELSQVLEGLSRPGHFSGVTTVVAKLFNVFQPQKAYFGEKDIQQALVVQRMTKDLNFNTQVVICPTLRETNGLAMSSRNVRLTHEERQQASCIYQALMLAKTLYDTGEGNAAVIKKQMEERLGFVRLGYISIADPLTLEELKEIDGSAIVSLAVFVRDVRLIDNLRLGETSCF